jgi:hypothetical protein
LFSLKQQKSFHPPDKLTLLQQKAKSATKEFLLASRKILNKKFQQGKKCKPSAVNYLTALLTTENVFVEQRNGKRDKKLLMSLIPQQFFVAFPHPGKP